MNNQYDYEYIKTIFANEPNFEADLASMFDIQFRSIDTSDKGYGNEVFSLTRKWARYLLHNCKHQVPDDKQINKILRLKANLEFNGMKANWTNKPVTINNTTREIEDGITRLYAIALGKGVGYNMPMLLKED